MVSEHFWLDTGMWTIWYFVTSKNYQDLKSEQCLSASASAGHWISIGQSCHCRGANQKPWVCKSRITKLHLLVSMQSFRWILMYRFVSKPSMFTVWFAICWLCLSGRDLDLLTVGQKDALLVLRTICKVSWWAPLITISLVVCFLLSVGFNLPVKYTTLVGKPNLGGDDLICRWQWKMGVMIFSVEPSFSLWNYCRYSITSSLQISIMLMVSCSCIFCSIPIHVFVFQILSSPTYVLGMCRGALKVWTKHSPTTFLLLTSSKLIYVMHYWDRVFLQALQFSRFVFGFVLVIV